MTNYNKRLDEILAKHGAEPGEMTHSLKQAILRWVADEVRLDERNKIALDTYRGKTVSESTNWQAKFEYFMDSNERRIAELKAQQEEV